MPVTSADIDAMIAAAGDSEVDGAPLKIGHVDPRFDGEPAYGWVTRLRRQGDTLLADITDVPAELAGKMRSAYRRRSAEIAWNVKTPSGRTHRAVLSGLALLGVTAPAVKGLADVGVRRRVGLSSTTHFSTVEATSSTSAPRSMQAILGVELADVERQAGTGTARPSVSESDLDSFGESLRSMMGVGRPQ